MEQPGYEKRGYLHEDFHLFHLCDAMREPVDWHYHTFHKLIFFLGGERVFREPAPVCVHISHS